MPYRIRLHPDAKRETGRLPGHVRRRVLSLIDRLAGNPTPPGARDLTGLPSGMYRIRLDRFRLVYRVAGDVVRILRAGLKEGPGFSRDLPTPPSTATDER